MSDEPGKKPIAAGKSSYDLVDTDKVFGALNLKPDTVLLDLACGRGAYSLEAAKRIGDKGLVYGVDLWEEGIRLLEKQTTEQGFSHVRPVLCNASKVPIDAHSIDICLMATVLHDFVEDGNADAVLKEVARLLKPNGILAIVEFKQINGPPGPPMHIRMSPSDVEQRVSPFGFKRQTEDVLDVGPYNYLMKFSAA